jgi:hypothetical protein
LPNIVNEIKKKIEGVVDVTGRQKRLCQQLLGAIKETKGYWTLLRGRTRPHCLEKPLCGRGSSPVALQSKNE